MFLNQQSTETGIAAGQSLQERDYWLTQLGGEWTRTRFHYDYREAGKQEYKPETVTFKFTGELLQRLIKVSKGSDAKLHMILVTGLVLLLGKYTGKDDIIIGSPIYRQKVEGEFINTLLPLRNRLKDNMTFKELLLQVRQTIHEAVKNQNYPMDKLIYELDLPVSGHRFPLFEVVLLLENIHDRRYIAHIPVSMIFSFLRTGETVEGRLEYDSSLYGKGTGERIAAHFSNLLNKTLFDVDVRLSAVDVITGEEKKKLISDFNDTDAKYPADKTLHELFADRADKNPGHMAVIRVEGRAESLEQQQITYRELNKKSNQLARLLREKGVGADTIVGIMAESSLEMAAAIFAVLKAGGAYLPIDPGYPRERIDYMLKDSNAALLLTSEELADVGSVGKGTRFCAPTTCNLHLSLAYIIYTSGSTGKPKGVLIEHRSILNYVFWRIKEYRQTSSDISLQLVSFSFDGFCANFYPALLSGGTVVLIGQDKWRDTGYIRKVIREEGVTNFSVVPSMYRVLLDGAKKEDFKSVRFVVLAGEKASADLLRVSQAFLPGVEHIDEYGPTENAVTTTCTRNMTPGNTGVIGRPISNNRVFILDEHQHLKPLGVPGELCIAGPGLARGYLNQPELTAEKFDHDLWDYQDYHDEYQKLLRGVQGGGFLEKSPPGRRRQKIYKTGDFARWLADGTIEILGRIDNQVQIRGFRVEPDEIERHLLDRHDIKEAAVIVKEAESKSASGNMLEYNYLCAYIVCIHHNEFNEAEIRDYLSRRLPDYMVPTYLVAIKEMPLGPTGKIDRQRLSEMEVSTGMDTDAKYAAPRNEIEKKLAAIWSGFLEKDRVGIKDNFFNIGGDSIKTIGLLSLINKEFTTSFDLVDLYENETIEKFAEKINQYKYKKTAASNLHLQEEAVKEIEALKQRILDSGKLPVDREIEDIYPMSDIEKGMIYYSLRDTTPTVYYNQVVYQLEHRDSEFDEGIFKKTFQLLVEKHGILRTGFNMADFPEPVQAVYKQIPIDVAHEDISHLDRDRQETHINAILEKDRMQPFDIERPESLWRVKTFLLDNENIIFIWIGHHALIDGWSSASLVTELNNIYLKLKTDPDFVPRTLKASYKNFVVEQRVEKQNSETITYWKKELADYKRLKFPGSFKLTGQPGEIKNYTVNLGSQLLEDLTGVGEEYGTSARNLCFAAYLYMLNMLSYESDIVVGLVTNNRPNCEDGDKIIGCFLNTIPVRIKIPAPITCSDYIDEVEKKVLELKRYDKLSLFEIVRITGEETQAQNPLFDTIFNFVDFHVYSQLQPLSKDNPGTSRDSRSRQMMIEGSGSINTLFNFDVNITMGQFYISLTYSDFIIDDALAFNCCRFFKALLNRFIHEPGSLLEKGTLLPAEERQELLEDFNRTEAAFPHDKTLSGLFETQVEKTPDKIAVVGGGGASVSYRELNEKSGQLGCLLREKGVRADTVAAIMMERSIEMIVGILGILKAGGAYLPIDPECPEERKEYMLADSGAKILLTNLSEGHHIDFLASRSSNLAYIIYTSGTTGRPKGVAVEHCNAVNTVTWFGRQYRLRPGIHVLMMSDYTFDASVNQIFATLLHGAALYIINREMLADINGLRQLIEKRQIHIINFVPVFLKELLGYGDKLASLEAVISGAEPLEETAKDKILDKGYALYNQYGPTEITIDALCAQCTHEKVTLGKPISNVRCFILDKRLDLLPVGVPGELFIAGAGVTRGYLNNPELTAEKFITAPASSSNSSSSWGLRLAACGCGFFKTGDRARWLPDGAIEFLGRIDRQVKIRGFRIEPEEIENRLLKHPEIKDAVAAVRSGESGDNYLCAYIVPGHGDAAVIAETPAMLAGLREFLMETLPDYMVPSYFVFLEAIPLTPGGKIDRNALPEPGTHSFKEYVSPRSKTEEKLVEIWSEVLGVNAPIGIDDSFFDLGGHSLKAAVLSARIHKELDVKLPLAEIFKYPTIRGLSQYLERAPKHRYHLIEAVEEKDFYGLSYNQKRLWFINQLEPGSSAYNMPGNIVLEHNVDEKIIKKVLYKIAERHESFRTGFETVNDEPVQVVRKNVKIPFRAIDISSLDNEEKQEKLEEIYTEEVGRPFDLAEVPLFRTILVRLDESRYDFIFSIHHIISDGWSIEILKKEFHHLYEAYLQGQEVESEPLKLQYKDFAEWQYAMLASGELKERSHRFWREKIKGGLPKLQLPADYKEIKSGRDSAGCRFGVRSEIAGKLHQLAKSKNTSLYVVVFSILNVLLSRLCNQKEIVTAILGAGREHMLLHDIVGFFVNTLVMKNHIDYRECYPDFLHRVNEELMETIQHQGYPLELVFEDLKMSFPELSVLFNMFNMDDAAAGRELDSYEPSHIDEKHYVKFDMMIYVTRYKNGIEIQCYYRKALFKREKVAYMMRLFSQVIERIALDPRKPVTEYLFKKRRKIVKQA